MNKMTPSQRIADAEAAGVKLSDHDKAAIFAALEDAQTLYTKASHLSNCDPMNKGHAFPMGVGFTRMTKRAEQRIDASVRRAGESLPVFAKANQASLYAEALLSGTGTEDDKLKKAIKREQMLQALIVRLISWKKGDKIAAFSLERINKDRDGYPSSYTISGNGIIKGVYDKIDVVREFFKGNKSEFRAMVDAARARLV